MGFFCSLYRRDFRRKNSFLPATVFFACGVIWILMCGLYCVSFIVGASEPELVIWRWALNRALIMQLFIPNLARLLFLAAFALTYVCDSRRAVMEMSYINKMYGMF